MELQVVKTETGATPKLLKREMAEIGRDAGRFAGGFWHSEFRPLHFKNLATTRYGYALRQGEGLRGQKGFYRTYTGQKLKRLGHTRPLIGWNPSHPSESGGSMRATEIQDVRATYRSGLVRIRVVMHAPKLNFRRWPTSPDMRKELTTVIPEELEAIAQATRGFLATRINLIRSSQVTVLRAGVLV